MQVSLLIEKLKKMDPDLEILLKSADGFCYDVRGNVRIGYVKEGGIEIDPNNEGIGLIQDRVAVIECLI